MNVHYSRWPKRPRAEKRVSQCVPSIICAQNERVSFWSVAGLQWGVESLGSKGDVGAKRVRELGVEVL